MQEALPTEPTVPARPRAYRPARWSDGNSGGDALSDRVSELVERARGGDRDAFGDLYRLYQGRILRLARFYLQAAGEDAASETFVRAWACLPRYRDTGAPFVSWLYGIARHVLADAMRTRGRTEPRAQLPDAGVELHTDDRLALAEAISRLPEGDRRVIELKFLLGLTNAEVGTALGKSPGAVNAQQWRALRTLRAMMEER